MTENSCKYAKKCGACQLANMPYEKQLSFKMAKEIKLLGRFGKVQEIIGMDEPYFYRNKSQYAFGVYRGKTVAGVYQSSTHNIVDIDSCLLTDKRADEIFTVVKKLLISFKLKPYDEKTGTGFLRHLLVKTAFQSGETMVVLVTATREFPKKRSFINALVKNCPYITTVVQNVNSKFTAMVLGDKSEVLYGDGKITELLCGMNFRISPKAFYQINPVQTEILYGKALEFADFNGTEEIIDAYCGTGTIGLIASGKVKSVIGVEINKDAVKDAKENAALNNVKNISFFAADAGKFMTELAENGKKIDAVIMDPARAGADMTFLSSLVKLSPQKIIYVSCNPETLARDLLYLTKNGYKVRKIQPVDMFPHTEHIETVVLLSSKQ
ncbi:MAG: 23S rRNA (uracil(1939)-C(5))-methyltransferase RlmD [Oscillospiraceae bacterium]|nr:23S rRNA (uracil(1939)-C(5))-methyltransferase RlmD [Oscillospiraceae bacterium]